MEQDKTVGRLTPNQKEVLSQMYDTDENIFGLIVKDGRSHFYLNDRPIQERMVDILKAKGYIEFAMVYDDDTDADEIPVSYQLTREGKGKIFVHRLRVGK